jgi:hypothetical protein
VPLNSTQSHALLPFPFCLIESPARAIEEELSENIDVMNSPRRKGNPLVEQSLHHNSLLKIALIGEEDGENSKGGPRTA